MPGFLRKEPSIEELEAQQEVEDAKLSVEEKKMLREKIKRMYGDGADKSLFKGIRSGISWDSVKFKVGDTSRLRGKY